MLYAVIILTILMVISLCFALWSWTKYVRLCDMYSNLLHGFSYEIRKTRKYRRANLALMHRVQTLKNTSHHP